METPAEDRGIPGRSSGGDLAAPVFNLAAGVEEMVNEEADGGTGTGVRSGDDPALPSDLAAGAGPDLPRESGRVEGGGGEAETLGDRPVDTTGDSQVSQTACDACDSTVADPPDSSDSQVSQPACDSTVVAPLDSNVNHSRKRAKSGCDSTVATSESCSKPKALTGHEWRRQGTGWTLLRSWYEAGDSGRVRRRGYVQHYSATALRRAETLRK